MSNRRINPYRHAPAVVPEDIMNPALAPVRYKVLTDGDNSVGYAADAYDDSAWLTGLGGWDSNAGVSPGTVIPTGALVRLWTRHDIILESTAGLNIYYLVDDDVDIFVNGVNVRSQVAPLIGEQHYLIPFGNLVVGTNKIAVRVKDQGGGRCLLYYRLEQ